MKAAIYLDAPDWQIGQDVTVYFPDTMMKKGKCEVLKVREKPERLLPCKCGCKRREHWTSNIPERKEILICHKCGFEAAGKNEIEAHKNWNKAVSKNDLNT